MTVFTLHNANTVNVQEWLAKLHVIDADVLVFPDATFFMRYE